LNPVPCGIPGEIHIAGDCLALGYLGRSELTAEHADTEVHILAYFVDTQNQTLLKRIAEFQTVRQSRIREMVAALNKLGIPLDKRDQERAYKYRARFGDCLSRSVNLNRHV